jgi:hypothetical protein
MTERTSHLARLWIGATISKTFHSKNQFYHCQTTTAQGKASRSTAVFTLSVNKFPIDLHVTYIYFLDTTRVSLQNLMFTTATISIHIKSFNFFPHSVFSFWYDSQSESQLLPRTLFTDWLVYLTNSHSLCSMQRISIRNIV